MLEAGERALVTPQELGRLAEGGSNLDQLAGAGAAVELAGAVLAFPSLDVPHARGGGGAAVALAGAVVEMVHEMVRIEKAQW